MPTDIIWHHKVSRNRVVLTAAGAGLAAAIAALATGSGLLALGLAVWAIAVLYTNQRPHAYERSRRAPFWFRIVGMIPLVVASCFLLARTGPVALLRGTAPLWSLAGGLAVALVFTGLHWTDTRLLLSPEIIELQPKMSPAGVVLRPLYVVIMVPVEELFYRGLLAGGLRAVLGAVAATLISAALFVGADIASAWGPASQRRRVLAEAGLGAANAALFLATGSLAGPLLAHYAYNAGQLMLPAMNFLVHRRGVPAREDVLV
jgi:membrane protease YdiL (CAAX protease family)